MEFVEFSRLLDRLRETLLRRSVVRVVILKV